MNERIRQLAEQAGLRFTQLMSNPMVPVVDGKETDLEKFAELIVREMCQVIDTELAATDIAGECEESWKMGMECSMGLIKKHFGVE